MTGRDADDFTYMPMSQTIPSVSGAVSSSARTCQEW